MLIYEIHALTAIGTGKLCTKCLDIVSLAPSPLTALKVERFPMAVPLPHTREVNNLPVPIIPLPGRTGKEVYHPAQKTIRGRR